MKLRCFFGPEHGRWHKHEHARQGQVVAINGAEYLVITIAGRLCMMHEPRETHEVLDWLFKYDPEHPQEPSDPNHPRNEEPVRARASGEPRFYNE